MRTPWTRKGMEIAALQNRQWTLVTLAAGLSRQANDLRRRVHELESTVTYLLAQDQRGLKDRGGLSLKEYMEGDVDSNDLDPPGPGGHVS